MRTNLPEVVTVGNATIDAFLTLHHESEYAHVNPDSSELCLPYGQKIPLEHCDFQVGGNAANVAVGLTRAGFATMLLAETGVDEFSAKIMNNLEAEGVDTTRVQQKGESSFSVGLEFHGERTIFSEHRTREHNFSFTDLTPRLIYLTSIGNTWEHVYEKTLEVVKTTGVTLACNPGTLQILKGKDALTPILHAATLTFLNKEEAEKLFGIHSDSVKELLVKMRESIPGHIVLTNGADGAYVLDKEGRVLHIPHMNIEVVEKTGAGDAFASGFLTGYLREKSLAECLKYGTINAAGVMSKVGAQPGILREKEYDTKLAQAPEVEEL